MSKGKETVLIELSNQFYTNIPQVIINMFKSLELWYEKIAYDRSCFTSKREIEFVGYFE
jgi:hypothetical protein